MFLPSAEEEEKWLVPTSDSREHGIKLEIQYDIKINWKSNI